MPNINLPPDNEGKPSLFTLHELAINISLRKAKTAKNLAIHDKMGLKKQW